MKAASPKRMDVDKEELLELIDQSSTRPLSAEERGKLRAGVETLDYVTNQVRMRNQRLYRLLFGPSSEKTSEVFGQQEKQPEPPAGASSDDAPGRTGDDDDKKKKRKGHGRRPASAYRGAERTCVPHDSLRPGQTCPACGKGKLYQQAPAVLVRLRGRAPLDAKVFECDRLRCNLCLEIFTAPAPPEAGEHKYDDTAAAMIALLRYGSGMPHHRLARLQQSLGIPLPASTQWRVVDRAAQSIEPVYDELVREAAQGEVVHNDDTKMPVLALTGKRRAKEAPEDDPPERTGMFTTGIVSRLGGRRITLFFTGRKHAGENMTDMLARRAAERGPPIHMCDGLERNLPKELATLLANCLSHGRRHFVDVAENFPDECRHVLEELAIVFRNDAHCRKEKMSDDERLAFHQDQSGPVMAELKKWLEQKLERHEVEPNSGLGQAFRYMLDRWDRLTLFLRAPGAPLENNICERALKRAIVHRKNSLFYRSLRGAQVGDAFMSLIHTAIDCGADPFDYLVALQRHADAVRKAPAAWMPWNYTDAVASLLGRAA
jgi:transposase